MTAQTHHSSPLWNCVEMILLMLWPLIYVWMSQINAKISGQCDFVFCLDWKHESVIDIVNFFKILILNWKWDHLSVTYLKLASKNDNIVYLIIYHRPMLDWSKSCFFFQMLLICRMQFCTPSAWYHTTSAEDRNYIWCFYTCRPEHLAMPLDHLDCVCHTESPVRH